MKGTRDYVKYRVYVLSFPRPSVVSEWQPIKSQSGNQSQVTFKHGLNELPYKVVVEVKINSNGTDYIFHAIGSATADDDYNYVYGGVIFLYDEVNVIAMAPNAVNNHASGIVIYTGSHGWTGPCCIGNSFTNAMLRIKVWGPNDLGVPDFLYNWRKINTSDEVTFKEVPHGLGDYPDLIVVQVQGSQSFTSEAQGSASKLNIMDSFIHMGGVVFGYSDKSVRIWYPGRVNTSLKRVFLIFSNDGWGNNNIKGVTSGYFRILAWKRLDNWCTETRISESKEIRVISDFDNSYVTVEVEAVDGSNDGFRFYGIGSVMNDGQIGDYGGLVYAYSDQKLLYWIPKSSILSGQAINIGGIWGRGLYNQTTDDVKIRVRVFNVPTNVRVCRMKEIVLEDFRVNKKSTSSYKRSKISVYDSRTSSVSVGSFGAFIIVTVIAVIIIPDLQNLFKHLKIGYRNLKLKVTDML